MFYATLVDPETASYINKIKPFFNVQPGTDSSKWLKGPAGKTPKLEVVIDVIPDPPIQGTFTLSYGGKTVSGLNYDISASALKSKLIGDTGLGLDYSIEVE